VRSNFGACLTAILLFPALLASGAEPPRPGQDKPTQEGQKIPIEQRVQTLAGIWEGESYWKEDRKINQKMRWRVEIQGTDQIRVTQLDELPYGTKGEGFASFGKATDSIFWSSNCELHAIYFVESRIKLLRKAVIAGKVVDQWVQMTQKLRFPAAEQRSVRR
jgi:hypothetical protein